VHVQKFAQVKTRALEDLDFVDEDVVEWVDGLASLLDILADRIRDQLVDSLLQVGRADLLGDDVNHLTADILDLLRLSVGSFLDLVLSFLGEADAEKAKSVGVAGFHIHASLDHGLPLLNHGPGLVRGEVHSVEVGETITSLDIFADEAELAEGNLVVLKIGERHFVDATLQAVRRDAGTSSLVDRRLADASGVEHDWGSDIVPFLAGERVDDLLLLTLLSSLGQTLVLSNCHFNFFSKEEIPNWIF